MRNIARSATSAGSQKRPAGICLRSSASSMSAVMSVRTNPGAMAFTVTPFLATSCASAFVAAITPPLAAA